MICDIFFKVLHMKSKIRVAIADDHQAIIDGYRYRLEKDANIKIVGTALDGESIHTLLAEHTTDVLILDVNLPSSSENPESFPILQVIPDLLQRYRNLSILVISMHTERALIDELMKAGAQGYILKDDRETIQNLSHVIGMVARGGVYFSKRAWGYPQSPQPRQRGRESLPTKRQLQVLSLSAAYPELSTAELAKRLNVKHATVRNLLSQAYRRLDVTNRAAAIAKARRLGLIPGQVLHQMRGKSPNT